MKYFFLSLLALPTLLRAQDEPIYDPTEEIDKHLSVALHVKSQKIGLLYDGDVMLPFDYESIEVFPHYLLLRKEHTFGVADRKGKIIIPADLDKLASIQDSLGYGDLENPIFMASRNGRWGFFDATGKLVIPMEFDACEVWEKSVILTKGTTIGVMTYTGKEVVPFSYSEVQANGDLGDQFFVRKPGDSLVAMLKYGGEKVPPGYCTVTPTLFARQTEVTVREWFAYMAYNKDNFFTGGDNGWQVYIPDTNAVEPKLRPAYSWFIKELLHDYGTEEHLAYKVPRSKYTLKFDKKQKLVIEFPFSEDKQLQAMLDFPVTGISQSQVLAYAEWLTGQYAERYYPNYYSALFFRLPTEEEWIEMAESGLHDTMKVNHVLDSVNAKGCMLYVYDNLPKCSNYEGYLKASLGGGTAPVYAMNPDYQGMHQLFGNVAEMVKEPGIAKGGSYVHPASAAETSQQQTFAKPQSWVGFRLVAELRVQ